MIQAHPNAADNAPEFPPNTLIENIYYPPPIETYRWVAITSTVTIDGARSY